MIKTHCSFKKKIMNYSFSTIIITLTLVYDFHHCPKHHELQFYSKTSDKNISKRCNFWSYFSNFFSLYSNCIWKLWSEIRLTLLPPLLSIYLRSCMIYPSKFIFKILKAEFFKPSLIDGINSRKLICGQTHTGKLF